MARLAAKENLLFYPTDIPVVQLIAGNISPAGHEGGSILDPCCGAGEAVALLGRELGLTTYGNELHPARAGQAKLRLDHCLNGPREFLSVDGLFNVIFNNPPYDFALSGQRMEFEHIVQDVALLVNGGLGVWVIPRHTLTRELCGFLCDHLRQINVRKVPDPWYDRFKQVVVFGVKHLRSTSVGPSNYLGAVQLAGFVAGEDLPTLQAGEFSYHFYTAGDRIGRFSLEFPEAARVLTELETDGIQTGEGWRALFGTRDKASKRFQPLLPLGPGHMAFVIASGLVDGTEVTIDQRPHVLKGSAKKQVVVTEETKVDEETQNARLTRWERERFVSAISAFSLHDGALIEYDNHHHPEQFGQFLLAHQDLLVQTVRQNHHPFFDPQRDLPAWSSLLEQLHPPGVLPGQQEDQQGLLPAQQVTAAALAAYLQTGHTAAILIGEMGAGKTVISAGVAALTNAGRQNWKTVVVCPSQVVEKWQREAEIILQSFGVSVHIIGECRRQPDGQGRIRKVARPVLDVDRAMAADCPGILVVSLETAKNGSLWRHAAPLQRKLLHRRVRVEEILPTYPFRREVEKIEKFMSQVLCCPDCGGIIWGEIGPLTELEAMGHRRQKCVYCGGALWQQIPFKKGGRMAIAEYLHRRYKNRFNLIIDEAHNTQGAHTDAGYASNDLIKQKKVCNCIKKFVTV